MTLLVISFLAGVLTIAAPCVFTLLPIIVGGTLARSTNSKSHTLRRAVLIAASLSVSIIIFTLLLQASTALLGVPDMIWKFISASIILLLGISLLQEHIWARVIGGKLQASSNKLLGKSLSKSGTLGDIATGAALGPVFTSCSPTYGFVVASVLPESFGRGMLYLLAYCAGLAGTLLVIALAGQAAVQRLGWLSNPSGLFRRCIGVLFIIISLGIITGLDKKLEASILETGLLDGLLKFENNLR